MALTKVIAIGNGVTDTFAVNFALGYISKDHITCRVDAEKDGAGNPVYRTITFLTDNLVRISGPIPALGAKVRFLRTVPKTELIIDFDNGDTLEEQNLDTAQKQSAMQAQEALDGRISFSDDLSLNNFKITDAKDPENAQDLVTKKWAETSVTSSTGAAIDAKNQAAASAKVAEIYAKSSALTRDQLVANPVALVAIRLVGENVPGDLGAGATYILGSTPGIRAIAVGGGLYMNLNIQNGEYNVGHFGAKGDGIADDGAAIVAAHAAMPSFGGNLDFPYTGAKYRVLGQIQIGDGTTNMILPSTKQNVVLRGGLPSVGTAGQMSNGTPNRNNVEISYEGAAQIDSVIWFRGPMVCGARNLTINGNKKANWALRLNAVFRSKFESLHPLNCNGSIRQDANGDAPINTSIGSSDNSFRDIHGDSFFIDNGIPTYGIDIGYAAANSGAALDVNRDTWENCSFLVNEHAQSAGVRLRGCDLVSFKNCFWFQGGERLGASIEIISPVGQPHLPAEVVFYNCPMYGRLRVTTNPIDGTTRWNPDSNGGFGVGLFPYAIGDAINPSHAGSADLNIPYGFYGSDDRDNHFGFFPQQRKFYGGYGYDSPASAWRNSAPVVVANTVVETSLQGFNLAPRVMRSRPQNLGAFTNAFNWDRVLNIKAFGAFLNNVDASANVQLSLVMGAATMLTTGPITLSVSPFYRRWDIDITVAASAAAKVDVLSTLRIWEPGSTGTGVANLTQTLGAEREGVDVDLGLQLPTFLLAKFNAANDNLVWSLKRFDAQII